MKNKAVVSSSSFEVGCLLSLGFGQLERILSFNPSLKLLSRGSRLRYKIIDSDGARRVVEFERTTIRFIFHFEGPIAAAYSHNLSIFLAILGMVEGSYQIMLSSLYGYIIDALKNSFGGVASDEQSRAIGRQAEMLESTIMANRQLSRALFDCKKELDRCAALLAIYRSFCGQLTEHLSGDRTKLKGSLVGALGIDESTSEKVLLDLRGVEA